MRETFRTFIVEITLDYDRDELKGLNEKAVTKKLRQLFETLDSSVFGVITVDSVQEVGE
jgi:hypothetical protein